MIRVLGIDPGSAATGWAFVESSGSTARLVASGVIRARGESRAERLAHLDRALDARVVETGASMAAVESSFSGRNPRSSLSLAEARGVVLATLGRHGIEVASYTPAEVKSAVVGHGRADKQQVVYMVQRILSLSAPPARDAADAMAVALAHLRLHRWRQRLGDADSELS